VSHVAFRERALRFGPDDRLTGILTLPETGLPGAPHLVLVSAGIVHRVGPDRLYVDLARAVAAMGYPVLRFDLSGLGYSQPATGTLPLDELVLADIDAACTMLAKSYQANSFIMCGLCSGANFSIAAALHDPRITGLILIDPTVARTRKGSLIHLLRRLTHQKTLIDLLLLRHPILHRPIDVGRSSEVVEAGSDLVGGRALLEIPKELRRRFSISIRKLIDQNTRLMMVFTGGVNHVYNYRNQISDLLPEIDFHGRLQVEYMPNTDHTVSDVPNRERLIRAVGDWLNRASAPPSTGHPLGSTAADPARRELLL